jgi:flavin-binding protein dodecin
MSNPTYKKIEIVGTSDQSFAKAADNAVRKASGTLHGLEWFEVTELRGRVDKDHVAQFQVVLKVGVRLD